ncbi:hypothetical protein [Achromobacter ruhlandii]|uniref:hypothetical protein n=1 Tax=Achromobacter ruhlandii TaxID=72557 RepID=UPI003B9FFA73
MKAAKLADFLKSAGHRVAGVYEATDETDPFVELTPTVSIVSSGRKFCVRLCDPALNRNERTWFTKKSRASLFAATLPGVVANFEVLYFDDKNCHHVQMAGASFPQAVNAARRLRARTGDSVYVGLANTAENLYRHAQHMAQEIFSDGIDPVPIPVDMPQPVPPPVDMRESLRWAAAALQGTAREADTIKMPCGQVRTIGRILDDANAALATHEHHALAQAGGL